MGCLTVFCVIGGIILFLLMEHTVLFWIAFFPLVILFLIFMISFFFPQRGLGLVYFVAAIITLCVIIVLLLFVSIPEKHEHTPDEIGMEFSFQSENSTALSYVQPFCKYCNAYFSQSLFRGTPNDTSYLEVIREYSGGSDIVAGEYYTITATVTVADYDINKTMVCCQVKNESVIVNFSVEFREEFEEVISFIKAGDEITFRGKFYDEGCGFKDCVLISE